MNSWLPCLSAFVVLTSIHHVTAPNSEYTAEFGIIMLLNPCNPSQRLIIRDLPFYNSYKFTNFAKFLNMARIRQNSFLHILVTRAFPKSRNTRLSVPPSGSRKCLNFGFWQALRTVNDFIYLLSYLHQFHLCS